MKKNLLILLVAVASLVSCGPKLNNAAQSDLKGDWTVTTVAYNNSDIFQVNAFGFTKAKCLEGSVWNFIPNNNKGSMTINNANCTYYETPIVWTITSGGKFTLKFVDESLKAKNVTSGYNLDVTNQTETSFQLVDYVDVAGKSTKVVYQFQKIN
ncbi:Lipocalin-like domain-containing protein [Pustulibacterium marinum]|uniref:Lipocalin-like domain-containing protein n=1 Tax=Pustulibacterium marinum TaxID=1224947 RepID=A0A1I7F8W5_9FLAO|nr:lipocalin family protein [Pustulibacterium marinum]SFU32612.1 Lipocalin-like domain-containing protein [Pustulibacterium marinum]